MPHTAAMLALIASAYVGSNYSQLELEHIPVPSPGLGEVLVKVRASAMNPIDWRVASGSMSKIFPLQFPATLGMDLAGEVVATNATLGRLKVGDKVWGSLGFRFGAFAQYAVAPEASLSLRPQTISAEAAATLPVVGLTSMQALDWAGVAPGGNLTVLIMNGAGGTGLTGIQIAKARGAHRVIAVASTANMAYVRALGADQVVDYQKESVWDVVADGSVDVVYDNLGLPGTADHAMGKLRPNGRLVVLAGALSKAPKPTVEQKFLMLNSSDPESLAKLHTLVEQGLVQPHVQATLNIRDYVRAFETQAGGEVVGKLSITGFN